MNCEAVVQVAKSVVGLSADPTKPESYQAYVDLIAPGETPAMKKAMVTMSGCGLVVAGIWRAAGLSHYKIDPPYIIGTAISRLITLARKYDAWVPYVPNMLPVPGSMVLIGDNGDGGTEHVYTVTEITKDGALISVDGGQRTDSGYQTILEKKHVWKHRRDYDALKRDLVGRRIYGWVNVSKLATATV